MFGSSPIVLLELRDDPICTSQSDRDNMKSRFIFKTYYYGLLLQFIITSACCNQVQGWPTDTPKICIPLVYLIFLVSLFFPLQIRNSPTLYCFSIGPYFFWILHAYLAISALICDSTTAVCKSVPFFIIFWHSSPIIHFLLVYFTFWFTPLLMFTPLLAPASSQLLPSHHEGCPAVSHTATCQFNIRPGWLLTCMPEQPWWLLRKAGIVGCT